MGDWHRKDTWDSLLASSPKWTSSILTWIYVHVHFIFLFFRSFRRKIIWCRKKQKRRLKKDPDRKPQVNITLTIQAINPWYQTCFCDRETWGRNQKIWIEVRTFQTSRYIIRIWNYCSIGRVKLLLVLPYLSWFNKKDILLTSTEKKAYFSNNKLSCAKVMFLDRQITVAICLLYFPEMKWPFCHQHFLKIYPLLSNNFIPVVIWQSSKKSVTANPRFFLIFCLFLFFPFWFICFCFPFFS